MSQISLRKPQSELNAASGLLIKGSEISREQADFEGAKRCFDIVAALLLLPPVATLLIRHVLCFLGPSSLSASAACCLPLPPDASRRLP